MKLYETISSFSSQFDLKRFPGSAKKLDVSHQIGGFHLPRFTPGATLRCHQTWLAGNPRTK